jgi:peptidoglycan/xylan/chitin deacetylase (PgdA/CDA1 family)
MIRLAMSAFSPRGSRARLTVLIFHRVLPESDPLFPGELDARSFAEFMTLIGSWFNVLPLGEAIDRLERGGLPARPLAITFDDGYRDNFTVALPILRERRLPATFFVATGFLDGGRMFNDTIIEAVRRYRGDALDLSRSQLGVHSTGTIEARRTAIEALIARLKYLPPPLRLEASQGIAEAAGVALPDDLMMTSDQVRGLRSAGMAVGAHTHTHPILVRLAPDEARAEIATGKAYLEEILGEPVRLFAYPNGKPNADYSEAHVRMVREAGFRGAVSTAWGAARSGCDVFQLPRFTPWGSTPTRLAARFARNLLRTRFAAA